MIVDLNSLIVTGLSLLLASFLIGYLIAFKQYHTVVNKVIGKSKKGYVMGLIINSSGIAEIKPLKLDKNYLIDEKGNNMWQIIRTTIMSKSENGQTLVEKGSDKPVLLKLGREKIPLYIVHELNAKTSNNPSVLILDPDLMISKISADQLMYIKKKAELVGRMMEMNKIRNAMYYFFILLGAGLAGYLIITALTSYQSMMK